MWTVRLQCSWSACCLVFRLVGHWFRASLVAHRHVLFPRRTCHGWRLVRPWAWYHELTGSHLNFGVNEGGLRQHIVRYAWRAWCLRQHVASNRRDHDIDCFSGQYFHRIDWKRLGNLRGLALEHGRYALALLSRLLHLEAVVKLSYYGLCLGRLFVSWHLGSYRVGMS